MNQGEAAARFRELHHGDGPLLMPNAWDIGSARLLASLGFEAIATTSSGFAATLGRLDGGVTRDEAIEHGGDLSTGVDVPVSADLEHGWGDRPEDAAETMRRARAAGLAGGSVEDFTGDRDNPIYERSLAAERVAAAVEAAHDGGDFVVTARAENLIHGIDDLDDTIARLQAFQEAGADVLFAPGVVTRDAIATVLSAIDRPFNVLVRPVSPPVAELAELGVARVSVGGSFAWVAIDAAAAAARELREQGTYGFGERVPDGLAAARAAFSPRA